MRLFAALTLTAALLAPLPAAAQNMSRQPMSPTEVADIDPTWIARTLKETGKQRIALSLCGAGLHTCDQARMHLRTITAQCTTVYLGVIDLDAHPGVPKNLYDTNDPRLILLLKDPSPEINSLVPVQVAAVVNPDTVAIVMCPEESRSFGHALRSLHMLGNRFN